MSTAKNGDRVKVHYTGKTDDQSTFSTSKEEPLEFLIGEGKIIKGLENNIVGMAVGERKQFTISPDEAFGERRDNLVDKVSIDQFPNEITPEVGQKLQLQQRDGSIINVEILDIENSMVTLDANHPLAGKDLHFEVELLEIA